MQSVCDIVSVCRLCLKPIFDEHLTLLFHDKKKLNMLNAFVTNLNLNITEDPNVCRSCYTNLQTFYEFKIKTIKNETIIATRAAKVGSTIDLVLLKNITKGGNSNSPVCRICLRQFDPNKRFIELNDEYYKIVKYLIDVYIKELNYNYSVNPVLCCDCWLTLQTIFIFNRTCLDTEEKLQKMFINNNSQKLKKEHLTTYHLKQEENAKKALKENNAIEKNQTSPMAKEKERFLAYLSLHKEAFIAKMKSKRITRNTKLCNLVNQIQESLNENQTISKKKSETSPKTAEKDVNEMINRFDFKLNDVVKEINQLIRSSKKCYRKQTKEINQNSSNEKENSNCCSTNRKRKISIIPDDRKKKPALINVVASKSSRNILKQRNTPNQPAKDNSPATAKTAKNKKKVVSTKIPIKNRKVRKKLPDDKSKSRPAKKLKTKTDVPKSKNKGNTSQLKEQQRGKKRKVVSGTKDEAHVPKKKRKIEAVAVRNKVGTKKPSDNSLSCTVCKFKTQYKRTLTKHFEVHSKQAGLLKCDECVYVTNRKAKLNMHKKSHLVKKLKRFKCEFCNYRGTSEVYLANHVQQQHSQDKFSCTKCSYRFKFKKYLKIHMASHINGNKVRYKTKKKPLLIRNKTVHGGSQEKK